MCNQMCYRLNIWIKKLLNGQKMENSFLTYNQLKYNKVSHLQSATLKKKRPQTKQENKCLSIFVISDAAMRNCCPLEFYISVCHVTMFSYSWNCFRKLIQIYDHFWGWNLWCCWILLHHIERCFVYFDHPLYNSEGRLTVDVKAEEISKSLKVNYSWAEMILSASARVQGSTRFCLM